MTTHKTKLDALARAISFAAEAVNDSVLSLPGHDDPAELVREVRELLALCELRAAVAADVAADVARKSKAQKLLPRTDPRVIAADYRARPTKGES